MTLTPSEREALRKAAGEASRWENWLTFGALTAVQLPSDAATFIAAADPPTILALLDALDSSEAEVRLRDQQNAALRDGLRKIATDGHAWDQGRARAALACADDLFAAALDALRVTRGEPEEERDGR